MLPLIANIAIRKIVVNRQVENIIKIFFAAKRKVLIMPAINITAGTFINLNLLHKEL